MGIVLYRKKGNDIESKVFDPFNYKDRISNDGWQISKTFKKEQSQNDKDIRQLAKEKGIKNWHNKKIARLIKELEEWQTET